MAKFLKCSTGPHVSTRQLNLSDNRIDDNVLATLANTLANNTMLKEMKLCSLQHVTITGWETFLAALRSNTLALEKLDLGDNAMPNRLLSFVAEALAKYRGRNSANQ